MESVVNEKDWKLFREKMPEWQNRYMDRLNREYIKLLNGEGKASDKFWALHDRIKEDAKDTGVAARMSRSWMERNIAALLDEGAITLEELEGFSEELREKAEKYIFSR